MGRFEKSMCKIMFFLQMTILDKIHIGSVKIAKDIESLNINILPGSNKQHKVYPIILVHRCTRPSVAMMLSQ